MRRGEKGHGQEVSRICQEVGLPDVNCVNVPKSEVKQAIFEHHYKDMVESVHNQTKLEVIRGEDLRHIQNCVDENSRMVFKVRSQMVPDIPGNYQTW